MPVDPQIQALLDQGTGVPATHTLPVAEARGQYEARIAAHGAAGRGGEGRGAQHRRAGWAAGAARLHAGGHRAVSR